MSENENRRDFSKYDAMTTEQLEQILRLDAEDPMGQTSDGELLLYVMEVLAQRKKAGADPGKTAQQAWESFRQHYMHPEEDSVIQMQAVKRPAKTNRPVLRRLTAVAAAIVLVIGLSATVHAFGWTQIFHVVATWAKDTFSFATGNGGQTTHPANFDILDYTSLQDALEKTGETFDAYPTVLPEGYEFVEVQVEETPMQRILRGFYTRGEEVLQIRVKSYVQEDPEKVEINGTLLEVYTVSGTEYYIFANMDKKLAAWLNGSYECCISGDLTVEEIKTMIDSIGKG